jgi:hypothetical protein
LTKPCVCQNTQVQLAAARLAAVDKAATMAAAAVKPVVAAHASQLVHEGLQLVLYAASGASAEAAQRWPVAYDVA